MWTKTAVRLDATEDRPAGWHYAQVWKTGGVPIGYCRDHAPHQTEREARECFAQYQRDNMRLNVQLDWTACHAQSCNNPTQRGAEIRGGFALVPLCPEHLTHEVAVRELGLDKPAGDSFGS